MSGSGAARFPWASIVAIIVVASLVYATGIFYANQRIAERTREALDLQQVRLSQTALRLEDYAGVLVGLSHVATATFEREHTRAEIQRDLRRLMTASDRSLIFGIGAFYTPYSFDPRTGRYGEYVEAPGRANGRDRMLDVDARSTYDYVWRPWYIAATGTKGRIAFTGPYTSSHGLTFLGASEYFVSGRNEGVVLVEALQSALNAMLSRERSANDFVWVTDADGKVIIRAAAPALPSADNVATTPLRLAPWTLHLASYFPDVARAQETTLLVGIPATIAYWLIVVAVIMAVVRMYRLQLRAQELAETASRDALTGLRNRSYMLEKLGSELHAYAKDPSQSFGVLFVDLDRFAVVNDSLGHSAGDELLRSLARRVEQVLPPGAEFGRIGGDEFVTFVPACDTSTCESLAAEIIARLGAPFELGEREIYISASIGIVICADRYAHADELLRDADTAMYAAKRAGRGRSKLFDKYMRDDVIARLSLENDLRRALKNSEVLPFYQPIVSLRTGAVASAEALARWTDGNGRSVSPSVFIPLAEQTGTIDAIDTLVLGRACRDAKILQVPAPGLTMSVNVSATRLNQGDLATKIAVALEEAALDPKLLKIELTETAIMEHAEDGLAALKRVRAIGAQIVIDDFGTGHSSLSYVQRLPVAGLKIDRSFITPIARDRQTLAIVRAVVNLAKTLGIYVTAEGVEDEEQVAKLREMGVDYAQGYYFSPALPYEAFADYVATRVSA